MAASVRGLVKGASQFAVQELALGGGFGLISGFQEPGSGQFQVAGVEVQLAEGGAEPGVESARVSTSVMALRPCWGPPSSARTMARLRATTGEGLRSMSMS